MKISKHQQGFGTIELLVIMVIVVVIAFVGYSVYNRQTKPTDTSSTVHQTDTTDSSKANDVAAAPSINSTSDLDKAAAALDKTDPDASNKADTAQLDSQLASF